MGCCWDPLQSGQSGPYCYDKNCRNPSLETCSASEHRVECGHHDMDQTQCEERDCCWDETSNSPSCFFKNEGGEDHNRCCPKGNRLECGKIKTYLSSSYVLRLLWNWRDGVCQAGLLLGCSEWKKFRTDVFSTQLRTTRGRFLFNRR